MAKKVRRRQLYVIQDGPAYKLGIAVDPQQRLHGMQTSNYRLLVLVFCGLPKHGDALHLEKKLHERFGEQLIRGEWYALNEKQLALVRRCLLVSHKSLTVEDGADGLKNDAKHWRDTDWAPVPEEYPCDCGCGQLVTWLGIGRKPKYVNDAHRMRYKRAR